MWLDSEQQRDSDSVVHNVHTIRSWRFRSYFLSCPRCVFYENGVD